MRALQRRCILVHILRPHITDTSFREVADVVQPNTEALDLPSIVAL